ncbi:Cu/Ag efflux protein CusF [Paraburkholderia sp. GAS333]
MKAAMTAATAALMIAAFAAAQPACAQDSMASTAQAVIDAAEPVHLNAEIAAIDPGSRTLTLKGPDGNAVVVLVSQQLAGFDQLKVGDRVDVLYRNALLVNAEKVAGADKDIRKRVDKRVTTQSAGGFESTGQTEVLATVQKIDRKKRLVTLRGVSQTRTFEAGPAVDLSTVKVGDTIHAVFVSAAAVQVTPAAQ